MLKTQSAFAGLVLLFVIGLAVSCTRSEAQRIPSPNGQRLLITTINTSQADPFKYLCVKFQITDLAGKVLYEEQTGASARMRWSMQWEGDSRVVLNSSDVGTYAWEQQSDGSWEKSP